MKLKNKKQVAKFINQFLEDDQGFLEEHADEINHGEHQEFSIEKLTNILQSILGKTFLKETLEYINLYPIIEYTEKIHKFVVQTIKLQLMELNFMSNKFYNCYSSKITNNYQNYQNYNEEEDGTINERGIRQAYAILKDIDEFKDIFNDFCVTAYTQNQANEINNKNFNYMNFKNHELMETIAILIPSSAYFIKDKLIEMKQYPTVQYNQDIHEFIMHIIQIELNRFKELDKNFYYLYTGKLNNTYDECYNEDNYYEHNVNFKGMNYHNNDGNINYIGINKAFYILKQIVEFKNVIDFN